MDQPITYFYRGQYKQIPYDILEAVFNKLSFPEILRIYGQALTNQDKEILQGAIQRFKSTSTIHFNSTFNLIHIENSKIYEISKLINFKNIKSIKLELNNLKAIKNQEISSNFS